MDRGETSAANLSSWLFPQPGSPTISRWLWWRRRTRTTALPAPPPSSPDGSGCVPPINVRSSDNFTKNIPQRCGQTEFTIIFLPTKIWLILSTSLIFFSPSSGRKFFQKKSNFLLVAANIASLSFRLLELDEEEDRRRSGWPMALLSLPATMLLASIMMSSWQRTPL